VRPALPRRPRRRVRRRLVAPTAVERGQKESPIGQALVEESVRGWTSSSSRSFGTGATTSIVCSTKTSIRWAQAYRRLGDRRAADDLSDEAYQSLTPLPRSSARSAWRPAARTSSSPVSATRRAPGDRDESACSARRRRLRDRLPDREGGAKLAVGYTLDEIPNDLTKTTGQLSRRSTTVVKFLRFALENSRAPTGRSARR
jgi:carbamoylphosphate synthase large subunit